MKVSEIMSKEVFVCRPEDNLYEAAALMWDNDIGALPVVNDHSKVIGMITDRDICMCAYTKGRALSDLAVHSAMSRQIHSCAADDKVAAAEEKMILFKVRRLPVLDATGLPVGILSLNDIALHAGKKNGKDLEPDQVVQVLASVCEPRAKRWQAGPEVQQLTI